MTEPDERQPLQRRLAGMLSELEDAEVALTAEQSDLSKRLAIVNGELDRIAKVKRTVLGEDRPRGRPRSTSAPGERPTPRVTAKTRENRRLVLEWLAQSADGQHFTAKDAARGTGIPPQGLGPILVGLETRRLVQVVGQTEEGRKRYRRTDVPVPADDDEG